MPGTHACLAAAACLAFFPGPAPTQPARTSAPQPAPCLDRYGDPLPPGAVARLGTVRLVGTDGVCAMAFSPDGKLLASGSSYGPVYLWDGSTGKEIRQLRGDEEESDPGGRRSLYLAFSRDGRVLFSASDYGVHIWEVSTGKVKRLLPKETVAVSGLACSPDGKMLATTGDDGCIRLWDVASGKELRCLKVHKKAVWPIAFSPDGKRLASVSGDRHLHVLDVDGKGPATPSAPWGYGLSSCIAFSPDGKWIAAGGSHHLIARIWDVGTKKEVVQLRGKQTEQHPSDHPGPLAFTPNGRHLVTVSGDGVIRIWNLLRSKEEECFVFPGRWPVGHSALSPDGKRLAFLDGPRRFRLYDIASRKDICDRAGHRSRVQFASFSGNRRVCSVSREDVSRGQACEWDPTTGKLLSQHTLWPTSTAPFVLPLSLRGHHLASIECDKGPIVWDVTTNKQVLSLERFKNAGSLVGLSSGGKTVIFRDLDNGPDSLLRVWDLVRKKEVRHVRVPLPEPHTEHAFSSDGKRIASEDLLKKLVVVWDVTSGKELRRFDSGDRIYHLEFSPDGTLLAAAYPQTGLDVWDVNSGKELGGFKWQETDGDLWGILTSWSIAFAPDSRSLASVGPDGTVWLWEVCTGRRRCRFDGHRGAVMCLTWSPNGRLLASGGDDTTLLVWDLAGTAIRSGRPAELTREQLTSLWDDLASPDAARAYRGMKQLAASPRQSITFLTERLRPPRPATQERMRELLARLDSRQFAERQRAVRDLEQLGFTAERALRNAHGKQPSLEVRQRLDRLLERLDGPLTWQTLRALEVLEWLGTADVRAALRELAEGDDSSTLTRQAKASLARLQRATGD